MDLNKASQKQLMQVHGIGKVLAKRLTQSQPFASWSQVEDVVQIGAKRLHNLQKAFVLEIEAEHRGDPETADPKATTVPKAAEPKAAIEKLDPNGDSGGEPKANADAKSTSSES